MKNESFVSRNPHTQKVLQEHTPLGDKDLRKKLDTALEQWTSWRFLSISDRTVPLRRLSALLEARKKQYAYTITREMGKPLPQAVAEVEKCAWLCRYTAENAEAFLQNREIKTDDLHAVIRYDPLGVIMGIMPWNFPFWQVFRFAIPAVTAGNVALLKHAPNVWLCAQHIETLMLEAGFPPGVLQHLPVSIDQSAGVIEDFRIRGIALTGSVEAGKTVASLAGKHMKKTVFELGGNNAFIICRDADLKHAVNQAIAGRIANAGQSCIAPKRFMVQRDLYDSFVQILIERLKPLQFGAPEKEGCDMGPLARIDLAEKLERQIEQSLREGACLKYGGQRKDAFYEPTVLTEVRAHHTCFREELFGPVFSISHFGEWEQAVQMSNDSRFGLGVSVFTKNRAWALEQAPRFNEGALFINQIVKSDPRLPFGGVKDSGVGRELAREGMLEFVNTKSIAIQ